MEDLNYDEKVTVLSLRVQRGVATPQERKELGELLLVPAAESDARTERDAPKPEPKPAAREVAAPTKKEETPPPAVMLPHDTVRPHDSAARKARLKKNAPRVRELTPLILETIASGNYTRQSDVLRLHKAMGQLGNDIFAKLQQDGLVVGVKYRPYRLTLEGYARINRTAPADVQITVPPAAPPPPAPVARIVNPGTQPVAPSTQAEPPPDVHKMVEEFVQGEVAAPKPATEAHAKQMLLNMDTHHTDQLKVRITELEARVRGFTAANEKLKKLLDAARTTTNPPPDWETLVAGYKKEVNRLQAQVNGFIMSGKQARAKIQELEDMVEHRETLGNASHADYERAHANYVKMTAERDALLKLLDEKTA